MTSTVSDLADTRLIVHAEAGPVFVEQYRRLGSALHQAQVQRGIRTLMVTSAVAAEGKTLSATNLALTLSRSFERRVLLVDGDLRKPSIHRLLRIENLIGLGDFLARPSEPWQARTLSPTFSVITGGHLDAD
jgi:Mrp family chromosome partitioning ATPase